MLITTDFLDAAVQSLFGGRISIYLIFLISLFHYLQPAAFYSKFNCLLHDHSSPLCSQISLVLNRSRKKYVTPCKYRVGDFF